MRRNGEMERFNQLIKKNNGAQVPDGKDVKAKANDWLIELFNQVINWHSLKSDRRKTSLHSPTYALPAKIQISI